MPRKLCSLSCTRPLDSSCWNRSLTTWCRHLEMIYTGNQCRRESPINFVPSSTSVCSGVPSGVVRACREQCESLSLALSCSSLWRPACPRNSYCYLWPSQLCCVCPKLWNSLPTTLRHSALTLTQFYSRLKTHLFGLAYGSASWLFKAVRALYKYFTHTYIQS